ncbi:ArsR/SmtB family transcription factor [Streptomyces coeruleoprunus]|uniref:ArsR/SmtB family transcription factor n=1 Tax=Streptomyces coeruleoprunus TaxID=285563 RepID=A0ABV9XLI2_9ACTN
MTKRPDGEPKARLYEAFAATGKALANGKRLELLDLLAQGERSVDALARAARLNLTTASAHLQSLKQAGLVATRRDGVRVHYRLAGDDVARLFALLRKVAEAHQTAVEPARAAYLGAYAESGDSGTVTRDELLARVEAGEVVVLDVRPAEEYAAGHIPGAISIPVDELAARVEELPEGVEVVAYCRGEYCTMARDAVRTLDESGRRAVRLVDGLLEWRLAALPVDVAAAEAAVGSGAAAASRAAVVPGAAAASGAAATSRAAADPGAGVVA